jgi:hypothetical protein
MAPLLGEPPSKSLPVDGLIKALAAPVASPTPKMIRLFQTTHGASQILVDGCLYAGKRSAHDREPKAHARRHIFM